MKNLLTVVCLVILPLTSIAQGERYKQITDPQLTSIRKEAPCSSFTSYTNEKDAAVNNRRGGKFRLSGCLRQMEIQLCRQFLNPPDGLHASGKECK